MKLSFVLKAFFVALFLLWTALPVLGADLCAPAGWCTQNGGTTGGGNAAPVTVTTLSALQSAASSGNAMVIYVSGTMGSGVGTRVLVASNKTIFGLPGATLVGGFDIKNASNVILRNMRVQGPGAVDVDGVDCITIDNSTNVWLDHLDVWDGQDGNTDVVNGSNYVCVSWVKFHYTGASQNHQFCNLVGNSDSKTTDRGKLKVTWLKNWWADGCRERMPRLRFGQNHVVNNLFNSVGNNHCVRAGIEADLMIESNVFRDVDTPIDLYEGNYTGVTSRNNSFLNCTGNTGAPGNGFTPPYTIPIESTGVIEAEIRSKAGATLSSPNCGGTQPTATRTNTPAPPTATRTSTSTATRTNTTVPPTATRTSTLTSTRSMTPTASLTVTRTATSTSTNTAVPPTSTRTSTASSTPSRTATSSSTSTASSTFTRTGTPTSTNTAIPATPTSTLTRTSTASSTSTRTATASATPSSTATLSATRTATSSSTPSPTATATSSTTPTASLTATRTSTLAASPTSTNTLAFTPTQTTTSSSTPTSTATSSSTPSPTATATSSATPTASLTATRTLTLTASSTSTATLVFTATQTATASPTPTSTSTASSSRTATPSSTATSTATSSLTLTSSMTPTASLTVTRTASNTATATASATATSSSTATSTQTPTATSSMTPTATLTTTLTASPTVTVTFSPTVQPGSTPIVFPNPVTTDTVTILPQAYTGDSDVTVCLYTSAFKLVATKRFPAVPAGQTVRIDLVDDWGERLADGVYYVAVTTKSGRKTATLILTR